MTRPAPASLVTVASATRRFGTFTAVDAVSMTVGPGEIVGLLGANGAGKTTLLKMILGLTAPTSGRVALFGAAPSRATRTRLGYVAQGLGLYATLTVAENLAFVTAAYGQKEKPVLTGALAEARDRLVGDIGLGLQRQLAFTAALAHRPELLILDEPTSGVDGLARARLWDTIHAEAERGVGVLVTTHYMQEAQQCDRLVLMARGAAVASGTEADIVAGTTAVAALTDDWAAAFDALHRAGLAVTLAGRSVRVADTEPDTVAAVLRAAGVPADVRQVPATLEEKMIGICRIDL
ncbi:ABC transporter ATP-binding protein [Longispora sp. NPDC051575]|uniref:ABC transporter ATP-binding protein n=1 Tax=Longispora sp. NPDC051575 TaxID=3154943 RepID=UPI00341E23C8